ncbi:transcription factor TGA like domain-containing protein [Artemisia annua]|uniref:Transcription factor TGA like domain-containing protein n=1 Tax=Artemisia annua TaxID=35608 RepID=A0A2U1Q892_ARTAN|nr:transcription factor TGA like domain-containing protein [Artemisia annua]
MAEQLKHQQSQYCYQNWAAQQRLDLDELLQAHTNYPTDTEYLQLITKKVITHFENYNTARAHLAKHDGPSFLVPTWGSTFENSYLWIGGCRPSLIIRLVYALCGSHLNANLAEFLEGVRHGNLGEISSSQLKSIDDLQAKTIKDEDKLTSRSVENVADEPLGLLANNHGQEGQSNDDAVVDEIMDSYALDQYSVLIEADKLRLNVLKCNRASSGIQEVTPTFINASSNTCIGSVENVADEPLGLLANNHGQEGESNNDAVVDEIMDSYALDQYSVLIEADKLRLNVLKCMIDILTSLQAIELLVASKKLHLSLHEWGKRRDIRMGITELLNNSIPSSSHDQPPKP